MLKKIITLFGFTLLSLQLFAIDQVYTGYFSSLAISGYDTVAYFSEGKPVEGKKEFETEYNGATWRFSNQANLNAFKAEPKKYAPQYGGYCSWKMGVDGGTASSDPKFWSINDGKLYLNYDKDIYDKWREDPEGFITKANDYWKSKHGFNSLN